MLCLTYGGREELATLHVVHLLGDKWRDDWKLVHILHGLLPFTKCEVINLIGFHILWEMALS